MDINSLLSPSETPRANSLTPGSGASSQSPLKHVQRTHSGPGTQPTASSPLARAIQPPSSIPAHVRSPSQQPPHSSPLISPVPIGSASTPFPRSSSTSTMENLADLASIQNHQSSKLTPPRLSSCDSSDSQKSSSGLFPHLTSAGVTSNPRASFDIAMVETPKQLLRADYTDSSLPVESQQRLATLVAYVQETPSSYDAHREIIKILHQGFVDHIYPSSSPNARRDPRTYDLLPELRQARENLDKLFAVGEEQWLDWLQDESILAQTAEERVAVVDKCRRAVSEEYGSTQLWIAYGDWVLHCYKWALDSPTDALGETVDAERLVGREVFDWKLVIDTWTEGVERTKHDMSRSHEVWDKYMTVRFGDTGQKLSSTDTAIVLDLFQSRLRVPHAEWQSTFQSFSTFVSANLPADQYESVMASNLKESALTRKLWENRDMFETMLREAHASGDQSAEYQAFLKYIEWECAGNRNSQAQQKGKGKRVTQAAQNSEFDMILALHQRAELRFPSVPAIWEQHIDYLLDESKSDLLEILARATKHCPWSGALWKQYLLTSELADESFDETEKVKHKATSTGLLDAAGIEEALIVYDAWCGYLLRRTKRPDAVEEDADVAEMGIRSSIEAVHSLASKLGIGADFDPSFRLQRKYVEYLKSQRRFDNARAQFDDALVDYGKHYKFWLRFYEFELQKSVQMALIQRTSPERAASLSSAPFAVGVLKQGLQYPDLDYPEPLMDALLNHCEDYEDADELQSALSLVRKVRKSLTAKRHREAVQAKEIALRSQPAEHEHVDRTQEAANGFHIGKRKRDDEPEEHDTKKRSRGDDVAQGTDEPPATSSDQFKRDREHSSILVQNLPTDVTETKIRQYFSSCGTVKSLKLLPDEENGVVIEFEDADAASYALSRDGREFEGSTLSVVLNTGSTLFVTNYPAAADEAYIRKLFSPYGEILNVRFPSLQRNKRRRFCYVEFKLPAEAQDATELDNKEIDGLHIVVKISNPAARHARTGKENDGRTIFVGQLPFRATVKDVDELFSQYGKVEHVKLPQNANTKGQNRGIAFVTFANSGQAQAALAMNEQGFMSRTLAVHMTADGSARTNQQVNGRSKSPSMRSDGNHESAPSRKPSDHVVSSIEERRQRTIAICDVPDTVNESRIKAIAEKIGPVYKVILKTNHRGALIEFENIPDAGRAMIELDDYEIDPGRHIRVTSEKEMLQQKPEHRQGQFVKRPAPNRPKPAANGPIKRPTQPGIRKGGHLGQRSALFHSDGKNGSTTNEQGDARKKTNDDFRNLISKGGEAE
ncbi:uncharacterized protein Z518_09659 [Rhinocladiella mackenziei CBS 650.93]|uniref:U4/U6 snRNA-associated-splicing factor PRP24 n=1 Tax=Rhinocladiella mackenziei CBS 650.93 TaxID=1442369 RepID=A0A0D2I498_9EURO|nr:uncharacterized protein Z518_09659 [Rhinocladiella mackenziei CBS 650.93]KIX00594.1 hypothetical protein Z518_09659 [Rhinocladiella mackenziei CBS 650.93]